MTPLTELLGLVTVIVTGSVVAGAVVFMCVRARSSSGWFIAAGLCYLSPTPLSMILRYTGHPPLTVALLWLARIIAIALFAAGLLRLTRNRPQPNLARRPVPGLPGFAAVAGGSPAGTPGRLGPAVIPGPGRPSPGDSPPATRPDGPGRFASPRYPRFGGPDHPPASAGSRRSER